MRVLPNCKRDDVVTLRAEIAEDGALQSTLVELRSQIESLAKLAAAGGNSNTSAATATKGQEQVVSLSRFLWLFVDRGLVKEIRMRNSALGVLPPPDGQRRYFTVALSKEAVHTAFLKSGWQWSSVAPRDEAGAQAREKQPDKEKSGLGIEDFVEAIVRCADVAWSEVRLMERSRRVRALVRCLLKQATEEELLHEVLAQWAPPQYVPSIETDHLPGEAELQFQAWRKVWRKVELRDLSGFATWESDVHRMLHKAFAQMCGIFSFYCESGGSQDIERLSGLALRPRSELGRPNPLARLPGKDQSAAMRLTGWLQLLHDADLLGPPVYVIEEEEPTEEPGGGGTAMLVRPELQKRAGRAMAMVVGRESDGVDVPTLVNAVEQLAFAWRPGEMIGEEDQAQSAANALQNDPKARQLSAVTAMPPAGGDGGLLGKASGDAAATKDGGAGPSQDAQGRRKRESRKGDVPTGARGRAKVKAKGAKPPPPPTTGMMKETTAQKAEKAKEMKARVAAADALAKKEAEAKAVAKEAAKKDGVGDGMGDGEVEVAPPEEGADKAGADKAGARARARARRDGDAPPEAATGSDGHAAGGGTALNPKFLEGGTFHLHSFFELLCRIAHSGLSQDGGTGSSFDESIVHDLSITLGSVLVRILPRADGSPKKRNRAMRSSLLADSIAPAQMTMLQHVAEDTEESVPLDAAALVSRSRSPKEMPPVLETCVRMDAEVEWRRRIAADSNMQELLSKLGGALRDLHSPPSTGLMKARPPAWRFAEVLALLSRCGLLCDVALPRLSETVGDPATATAFGLRLSPQAAVHAWMAMRVNPLPPGVRPAAPVTGSAVVLSQQPWAPWMKHSGKDLSVSGGEFINGGGLRLDEDGGGATYEEFVEMIIRCGEARYRGVSCGLPPDDSAPPVTICAEAILQHVTGIRSEVNTLQKASRIPFPRKTTDDMKPRDGESIADLERWKWLWGQLCNELQQVHLWPSWEPSAFDLLRNQLPRLAAIFSHYVKAGWTCIDELAAVTMDDHAWADFVDDCEMETPTFDAQRLLDTYAERAKRNGGPLHVIQFIGLLVKIAFLRVHPDYSPGDLDTPEMRPVPQCVDEMLSRAVYPRASSDPTIESATRQRAARGVIGVIGLHRVQLYQLYSHLGGDAPAEGEKNKRDKGEEDVDAPKPTWGVGLDEWLRLMEEACGGWSVETLYQHSEITGEPAVRKAWAVGCSAHQAMQAYYESRAVTEWWMSRLSFEGFTLAICRCAEAMFATVEAMATDQKVAGMLRLVLKMADRATVVQDYTYVRAPIRFDPVRHVSRVVEEGDSKGQYTGSSAVPIGRWLECWQNMQLKELHGFPTWDAELFVQLQPYFATLCRLFAAYAAPLPKGEADLAPPPLEVWSATVEMTPDKWEMLVDDMGLGTPPDFAPAAPPANGRDGPTGGSTPPPDKGPAHQAMLDVFAHQPIVNKEDSARSLAGFVGALLHAAFLFVNPSYNIDWENGEVDVQHLVPATESITKLLEHRVPLTLMRRCLARLHTEVDVSKAVYREKESKLQHARTRERNCAIEAAGANKRSGNKANMDDEDSPRRPLRHAAKLEAQKAKEKAASDPAELRAEVVNRQALLDEFARVLKRKQADQVLLEKELEPMNAQEKASEKEAKAAWAAIHAETSAVPGPVDDEEEGKGKKAKAAPGGKKSGGSAVGATELQGGGAPTTTKRNSAARPGGTKRAVK